MNEHEIKAAIFSIKKGENRVLGVIYKEYEKFCLDKLVKDKNCNREEAKDIYIESIMNLREKILSGNVTHTSNIRFYLAQTCVNMYLTRLEQKRRWKRNIPDVARFFYESNYLLKEDLQEHEKAISLARKIWEALGEKCKDIINYFYLEKLRMNEIAEIMGFANANVAKTIKARCYKKMIEIAKSLDKNTENEKGD